MPTSPSIAATVRARLDELGWTQQQLSERSQVSVATIRQVVNETGGGQRTARTLAALSEALRWPRDYLGRLGEHRGSASPPTDVDPAETAGEEFSSLTTP